MTAARTAELYTPILFSGGGFSSRAHTEKSAAAIGTEQEAGAAAGAEEELGVRDACTLKMCRRLFLSRCQWQVPSAFNEVHARI